MKKTIDPCNSENTYAGGTHPAATSVYANDFKDGLTAIHANDWMRQGRKK